MGKGKGGGGNNAQNEVSTVVKLNSQRLKLIAFHNLTKINDSRYQFMNSDLYLPAINNIKLFYLISRKEEKAEKVVQRIIIRKVAELVLGTKVVTKEERRVKIN